MIRTTAGLVDAQGGAEAREAVGAAGAPEAPKAPEAQRAAELQAV